MVSIKFLPCSKDSFYWLGNEAHNIWGSEENINKTITSSFLDYLDNNNILNLSNDNDPWELYCRLVKMLIDCGFYSYAELKVLSDNSYWMAESGQYDEDVLEETGSWQRAIPPCPLIFVVLAALSRIGYTVILDDLKYSEELKGFETKFHFSRISINTTLALAEISEELQNSLLPICCECKKIRDIDDEWVTVEEYFSSSYQINFTHGICPKCLRDQLIDFEEKT